MSSIVRRPRTAASLRRGPVMRLLPLAGWWRGRGLRVVRRTGLQLRRAVVGCLPPSAKPSLGLRRMSLQRRRRRVMLVRGFFGLPRMLRVPGPSLVGAGQVLPCHYLTVTLSLRHHFDLVYITATPRLVCQYLADMAGWQYANKV